MTSGSVVGTRKPLVPITILDSVGAPQVLRVILDTGFTGQLVLPERYMRRFGLTTDGHIDGRPATGEILRIPTSHATLIWQGRHRSVQVLQLDSEPLLGMEFLWHHRIVIDAITNGSVTITPLPT